MTVDELNRESDKFWAWFSYESGIPSSNGINEKMCQSLNLWMDKLGIPDWEIGPMDSRLRYLAISPRGDADKYETTKAIVSRSTKIPGWLFLAAKPKKEWSRVFEWPSVSGNIDSRKWKLSVFKYSDGMYEIVFFNKFLPSVEFNDKISIVEFVISSEIGEDFLINKVCKISFEDVPDAAMKSGAISVNDLSNIII